MLKLNVRGAQPRPFAFFCYEKAEEAQKAIDEMHDKPYLEHTENLYVAYAIKKSAQRHGRGKRRQIDKKVIYIRGLKSDVTDKQLLDELLQFGEIKSLTLKAHDSLTEEGDSEKKLKYAVIGFKTDESAQHALDNAWSS